jgi:membrane fusion protein (multidrug efflux system)
MKAVLAAAFATLFSSLAVQAEAPAAGPARVQLATGESAPASRAVAANVVAAKKATISTRVAASVRSVRVEEGDRVIAGQLLVTLADDDLQAQLHAARAGQASAAAQEKRIIALLAERAATTAELEQAQTQRAQADAAVRGAEAQLAYTQIRAPFAAVIQARHVSAGDLVGPGAPLFELDGGGLELQASLSEDEARGLKEHARINFEAAGTRGQAEITALVPGGDPISHRSGLRARVRTPLPSLRPGSFARLFLPAQDGPVALWVPRAALVTRGDLTGVFVVEGGVASLRWLSLAEREPGRVRVRAGLREGERFIAEPGSLRDGQPVEVTP